MAIGALFANSVYVANTFAAGSHDWKTIWLIPAGLAFATAVIFAVVFRDSKSASIEAAAASRAR
jgi:hypothetical protein